VVRLGGWGNDPLAIQNCGDLFLAQGVVFNGQRSPDGADTVDTTETKLFCGVRQRRQASDGFTVFCDQIQNGRGDGVGRLVGVAHDAAHSLQRTSACSKTSSVAFFSISGG